MVCARMLWTRLRGGSASPSPCRKFIPAWASATMARQAAQLSRCASKAASVGLAAFRPGVRPEGLASTHSTRSGAPLIPIGSHLPLIRLLIGTLQKPCQFRSSPIYATLHRSLGHTEDFGNILVVHILQVAQDDRFPELGPKPPQRLVDQLPGLLAAHRGLRTCSSVFQLLGNRQAVFLIARRRVQRVGYPIVLAFAEVVDQQIPRDRRYPVMNEARVVSYVFSVRYILMNTSWARSGASSDDPEKR